MPSALLRRAALLGASASLAGLSVLAVAPAGAASAQLDYTCDGFVVPEGLGEGDLGEEQRELLKSAGRGAGDLAALADEFPEIIELEGLRLSATFDSAIEDGATTTVGSTVELEPVAGTITLSEEITEQIVKLGITDGFAGALLFAGIEETDAGRETEFLFDSVSVPASGELTLSTDDGVAEPFRTNAASTFTYVAGDLELFIGSENEESSAFVGLSCTLDEDQDASIDQVIAVAAPTPTPTPTETVPTPVRPDVVQTDASQSSPSTLPLLAAGSGAVLAVGGSSLLLRRRAVRS